MNERSLINEIYAGVYTYMYVREYGTREVRLLRARMSSPTGPTSAILTPRKNRISWSTALTLGEYLESWS